MIARFHYADISLTQLLQDEGSVGSDELLEHLETCEECQARLDTLSSGGLSWDEVNELMRKDDPKVAELVGRYDEQREEPDSLATSATFLRPSDYPDSLGRFARYEVMEFLGRGGMGIVMRAYDTALQRNCAVKVLAPELASSAAARKRFSREARSAAAVVHPHVVPIQTVDEHNGLPYLVMPVVDGRSLQQRTEADGPLSVIETVRIAAQVAEGLAAAHAQGLVHRDIKPANILLENGVERVQLTDFGLARAIDDADSEFIIADGEFVLKRGGQWLARISESQQGKNVDERVSSPSTALPLPAAPRHYRSIPITPNPSQPLIGTWRLLRWLNANGDPATEVGPDNCVMTIEDSYVTVATGKVSPDENYFYRLLPGDVLHLIETSDNSRGGTETKVKYSFPDPNSLRFETLSYSGGESGWGSEWQRVNETLQSNAAEQIPPATLEPTQRRDDHPESRSEPKTQSPSPATHRAGIDDRKMLFVRLLGDKKLAINHPAESEGEVPDSEPKPSEPKPFTSDGIVLVFSLETPGAEACFHILDCNFNSIRAVVRLECSEFLSEAYWQRLGTQPIELNVSQGDFTSVLSGNLADRVVYLPDEKAGDLLQTKSYSGIGRPNDVVEDARKMGGQPLVSIRLDPPTAADQVAKSHQRVGPTFSSGRSTADFFNRCSDEEILQALQGSWAQTHFSHKGDETDENPHSLHERPLRVTFEPREPGRNRRCIPSPAPKSIWRP